MVSFAAINQNVIFMAISELMAGKILHFEAGVPMPSAETLEGSLEEVRQANMALFRQATASGWSDDSADRGGATMCGITIATYKAYCRRKRKPVPAKQALRGLSFEEWLDIFKTLFWDRWHADEIQSQRVAEMLVDWVWASGIHGIREPQKLLKVKADGIVGLQTLTAVNNAAARSLLAELTAARLSFVERIAACNPSQRKWLNGWRRRIRSFGNPST